MWAWGDVHSSFYYTDLEGTILGGKFPPYATHILHSILTLCCLCCVVKLESVVVLMLAYPPYINKQEEKLLLDVMMQYPKGMPDNDERDEDTNVVNDKSNPADNYASVSDVITSTY